MQSVKIIFELEPSELHSHSTETLWASPVGNAVFRVDNVPFYVYGVSCGDAVIGILLDDGLYAFGGIEQKAGHSTYRVFQTKRATDRVFEAKWSEIEQMGCTRENGGEGFYAIDVPPDANIYGVYELLERGEEEGVWVFEEGDCGHAVSD